MSLSPTSMDLSKGVGQINISIESGYVHIFTSILTKK